MRRLKFPSILLPFLLLLSACGGRQTVPDSPPPQNGNGEDAETIEDITIYDCGGLRAALPSRYVDLLRIETGFPGTGKAPLLSVYEKASYEAAMEAYGGGGGFLFGLLAMDQAAFEQHISADVPGVSVFAADGQRYYAYTFPTDVQFFRPGGEIDTENEDWKTWEELNGIGPAVRDDFLTRNGLQSFTVRDYVDRLAAEDGNHICLRYYPYSSTAEIDTRVYYQLLLRQPARQGEGGIWAVEQWMDEFGGRYLYFPDSGMPAAEYYAQLQEECEDHPELLTPAGAAAAFVRDFFGPETVEGSFEEAREVDHDYTEQNRRLCDMVVDIVVGEDVDGLELLKCAGAATAGNWGVLAHFMYGDNWPDLLMKAMADAAVGGDQQERTGAILSCLLSTKDIRPEFREPLNDILRRQRDADPEVFSDVLAGYLPECEPLLDPDLLGGAGHPVDVDVPTY